MLPGMNEKQKAILAELNEQQRLPVQEYKTPSLIIAGAGAGKTKTIVSRTAYMIEDGVSPANILLFTFTQKAADEMRTRVIQALGDEARGIFVGTYHSFCAKLHRYFQNRFSGYTNQFSIYDEKDAMNLLKKAMRSIGQERRGIPAKMVMTIIGRWKEKRVTPEMAISQEKEELRRCIASYYEIYQRMLKEVNALDFGDLINFAIKAMEEYDDVREAVNRRFRYVTADECQDSSSSDLRLIELLCPGMRGMCMVGDDSQSMYSFRGADLKKFFHFIQKARLKKFYLEQNYRSTRNIVEGANCVIRNNEHSLEKNMFTENTAGTKILSLGASDEYEQANQIANMVRSFGEKGIALRDIAVLYRSGFLAESIEYGLLKEKIPYRIHSNTPFCARKEVKDILACLRLIHSSGDFAALERVLKLLGGGFRAKDIPDVAVIDIWSDPALTLEKIVVTLRRYEREQTRGRMYIGAVYRFLLQLAELRDAHISVQSMIQRIIDILDYHAIIERSLRKGESVVPHFENINTMLLVAKEYDSLDEFIVSVMAAEDAGNDERFDGVNLMTIHASKGLEFRIVIVAGCSEGLFPTNKAIQSGNIEEERRIFYVAMTRAKEYLGLIYLKSITKSVGDSQRYFCSRFLNEIDKRYIIRREK